MLLFNSNKKSLWVYKMILKSGSQEGILFLEKEIMTEDALKKEGEVARKGVFMDCDD